MLTQAQILAEDQTAISDEQVLALTILVRQYQTYAQNNGLWPNFPTVLQAEQDTPTIKTQGLKAVLTALDILPSIVAESQGKNYFSTKQNWDTLAQDVLDILYDVPVAYGNQSFAIAQRPIQNLLLIDNVIMDPNLTGRRF